MRDFLASEACRSRMFCDHCRASPASYGAPEVCPFGVTGGGAVAATLLVGGVAAGPPQAVFAPRSDAEQAACLAICADCPEEHPVEYDQPTCRRMRCPSCEGATSRKVFVTALTSGRPCPLGKWPVRVLED